MRELELRVKQQSVEVEKGNALRQKVTQEKAQLEIHIASISAELQEASRRSGAFLTCEIESDKSICKFAKLNNAKSMPSFHTCV